MLFLLPSWGNTGSLQKDSGLWSWWEGGTVEQGCGYHRLCKTVIGGVLSCGSIAWASGSLWPGIKISHHQISLGLAVLLLWWCQEWAWYIFRARWTSLCGTKLPGSSSPAGKVLHFLPLPLKVQLRISASSFVHLSLSCLSALREHVGKYKHAVERSIPA